eukprot:15484494-Alexandrium_andersonii.AAC.1
MLACSSKVGAAWLDRFDSRLSSRRTCHRAPPCVWICEIPPIVSQSVVRNRTSEEDTGANAK